MFVHPGGVQQVAQKFPQVLACKLVVTREAHKDLMTLVCELEDASGDNQALKGELEHTMKEVLRVSGQVDFAPAGSLPKDGKIIDDQRVWD